MAVPGGTFLVTAVENPLEAQRPVSLSDHPDFTSRSMNLYPSPARGIGFSIQSS